MIAYKLCQCYTFCIVNFLYICRFFLTYSSYVRFNTKFPICQVARWGTIVLREKIHFYRQITCTHFYPAYPAHEIGSSIRRSGPRTPERLIYLSFAGFRLKNDKGLMVANAVWLSEMALHKLKISREKWRRTCTNKEQRMWYLYLIFTLKSEIGRLELSITRTSLSINPVAAL